METTPLPKVKTQFCTACGTSSTAGTSCAACGGKLGKPYLTYAVGQVLLGKYQITGIIGRGGMGLIYRARHLRLEKEVALKFIHAHLLADPEQLRRFQREAVTASSVEHPNALQVLDLDLADDGSPFLITELLHGLDLDQELKRGGPLNAQRAAELLLQVTEALIQAHAQGIIHRDLKPQNIFLCESEAKTPRVKLLDFGIAKLLRKENVEVTQHGVVLGTPHYMAPEQLRGESIDARADLWSMGVILYQLLTGKLPYDGSDPVKVGMSVLNDDLVPPSQRVPELEIDPAAEAICLRCLSFQRDERYPDAEALADDLRRLARPVRRRPRWRFVLAGIALALLPMYFVVQLLLHRNERASTATNRALEIGLRHIADQAASLPDPQPVARPASAPAPTPAPASAPAPAPVLAEAKAPRPSSPTSKAEKATPDAKGAVPTRDPNETLFTYGKRLSAMGKKQAAAEAIEEFLNTEPRNASAHRWLGDLYTSLGKSTLARPHYETFLTLSPNHPDARLIKSKLGIF